MELLTCNLYHITLKACPEEPIPLYVIQNCCRDLGQALDCLRTLGIIHGDIKPTNIMWNPVKEVFILGDFGLSFYEGKQPLQPIQSAGYQAPEVMRWNSKLKDPANLEDMAVKGCGLASDMWSLGCLLYFLYKRQHLPALPWQQSCNNCMQGKTCHSLCDVFEPQCPTNKTSILIQDLLAR
ncbi:predicted protein [Nematostella vectensis]|uniref:Protein kinase domain-containing protein n=1 Tax=Nematostella vectensis TaxID=45351 RepID=A7SIE2_NEMVE|nr:predicted protein [Nematostella vectensis]|eukprot:XP_001628581.1 predicted protein [Nematostella vectensis]